MTRKPQIDTQSESLPERFYPGAGDLLAGAPSAGTAMQQAVDLDRWHMVVGYTLDNINATMSFQAQDFLSGGDPEEIPISVIGPDGKLEGGAGMPRFSVSLTTGPCFILPLRSFRLDGRDITGGAQGLRLGFRLNVTMDSHSFDQLLEHPVVSDEVKFTLKKMLESGGVTRQSHTLASLRPRFTELDLGISLEATETQLNGIGEADRPRLLSLLQGWFRTLDDAHNPFFLGLVALARQTPTEQGLDTEPTLASFAYLLRPASRQSQIAWLLNCRGIPAPEGHVPGRWAFTMFTPPNREEPYQGALCVLPKLLITDYLLTRVRNVLQMQSAPLEPGFTMSDVIVRQTVHRVNPYGIAFNDCLRKTDNRTVSIAATSGVDVSIGRYAAVDVRVNYQRRMLTRKNTQDMDNDQTEFTDKDFDHDYPLEGLLQVTVRFRFTLRERRFVVDRSIESRWQPTQATTDLLWRMRNFGHGHAIMADFYEKEVKMYDTDLAMLEMLRFNLVPERCLTPGRTLLSFRDPQGRSFSTFDKPWAMYFSLTRNV